MRTIILATLMFVAQLAHGEVTATVDRTTISEIDLLTLTITVANEPVTGEPDFSSLDGDFEVIGTPSSSSSRQITLINGQQSTSSTTTYTVTLRPTRRGNLRIPPVTVSGRKTRPMTIRVVAPSVAQAVQTSQYVFFETSVDRQSAYVQSQIIYTLKLFYADTIAGDFPAPPNIPEAVVETIEDERRYESVVNNQRYYVLEKRYAIFPQKSGKLTIPAEIFRGTRGRGGLFGTRQSVSTLSQPIEIEVKPRPASFTGDTWLAARSLVLQERWTEQPPVFKVGEPVNRVLSMQAQGLAASLLPQFESLDLDGVKTYADPAVSEERASDVGLISSSVTTIGIVPTRSGAITLPAIHIPWWNTETNREEIAEIPAVTYTVLPADSPQAVAPQVTVPLSDIQRIATTEAPVVNLWMYGAIALALLWLISTWQWLVTRSAMTRLQTKEQEPTLTVAPLDESAHFEDLTRACQRNEAAAAHRHLFLWSHARFQTDSIQAFSRQLRNSELDQAIAQLEQALYGNGDPESWQGDALLGIVSALRTSRNTRSKNGDLVSHLNPV